MTLSGSLTGIVNTIRPKSYRYFAHEGVIKNLVTEVGKGAKGSSVVEPYLDPTARSGTAATEGTDFTAFTSYVSTTRTYTATEWAEGTILSYNDVEDAQESMMDAHAQAHGIVHGVKLEKKIAAVFASFTSNYVSASNSTSLGIDNIAAAKALLEGQTAYFAGPYNLAMHPYPMLRLWNGLANNTTYGVQGKTGDEFLDKYHVGTILGDVRLFQSNGQTAAATMNAALFVKEAIGLFMPRDYTFKTEENISYRGWELVSTHRAGARVRLTAAGVRIMCSGATPS